MKTYIEYISLLSYNKVNKDFSNSDEEHAIEVLVKIFEQSNDHIRIFAKSLCNNEVSNSPKYITALSDFIERGGKVEIAVNSYDEEKIRQSNLFRRLAYYFTQKKEIKVYKAEAKPYISSDSERKDVHFTIGDDVAYRLETDIEKRTAICNFNNPEKVKILIDLFERIKSTAQVVNINKVFVENNE
jgi:hypothetical protein